MSADVGRVHRIVHVADTGHEQGGGPKLLTAGAVRRRALVSMTNVGAVMQQRRRTHLAGRQLEPVQSSII